MIDLRDRLSEFEACARRILGRPRTVVVRARPARCHPDRPLYARGLCKSDYTMAHRDGRLSQYPALRTGRCRADFVADYVMLRSQGYTRRHIAERLGMTRDAVAQAYRRAVLAGDLTADRRIR